MTVLFFHAAGHRESGYELVTLHEAVVDIGMTGVGMLHHQEFIAQYTSTQVGYCFLI